MTSRGSGVLCFSGKRVEVDYIIWKDETAAGGVPDTRGQLFGLQFDDAMEAVNVGTNGDYVTLELEDGTCAYGTVPNTDGDFNINGWIARGE